jgi:hypothetical protein
MNQVRWLRWIQVLLALLFTLGAVGACGLAALRSPDVSFLGPGPAPWIWPAVPPTAPALWLDPARPEVTTFDRRFRVDLPMGPARLQVRAMRDVVVSLNGSVVPLPARDPRRWKEVSVADVTPLLVQGENLLHVAVRNPQGVGFLQLRLEGLAEPLLSDERWLTASGGFSRGPATIADDSVRFAESKALPLPLPALREHALALLLFAGGGMIGAAGCRGRRHVAAWAPTAALALVTLFWGWVYAAKIIHIPATSGFDGSEHLAYIDWLLRERTLPLATATLETYHPPLYHVLTALLVGALRPASGGLEERGLLSLLPALSGLGMAFVAAATARCLAPEAPWQRAGAAVAAGLLPSNLTLAASVSNELPHAFLASLAVFVTLRTLMKERTSNSDDLLLGVCLAGGLLTKYTSLMLVPLLVGAVVAKRILSESAAASRVALGAARTLAAVALLAGWVYVRNWIHFRDPLVSPLDAWAGETFWQYPGFHTASYFLHFGDALTQPWFSGFHSFWDAVYTTWWGDGMVGGVQNVRFAHGRWRYDWMAAVFLLALPATLFLFIGWLRAVVDAWRDKALGLRLAMSLLVMLPPLVLASLMSITLHYPFWSFGKGFYALFLTPTLSYLGVLGFDYLDKLLRHAPFLVRLLPWGWASAFFGSIALAYGG